MPCSRAVGVVRERLTDGRVDGPVLVNERIVTEEGVAVVEIAAFLANGSRLRRKQKAGEGETDGSEKADQFCSWM